METPEERTFEEQVVEPLPRWTGLPREVIERRAAGSALGIEAGSAAMIYQWAYGQLLAQGKP